MSATTDCPAELRALDLTDPTSAWVSLGSVCSWGAPEVSVSERGPSVGVAWRVKRTGTFTVRVLSSGRPVVVDGMAFRSY